ncbi:DUF4062 domain-containing protein [Ferribacterium limneticum]|uniref:DUF4062 domain-containing protein n=1 Tax=Ferribacterium limneticum TaxID=76259 RepID=UPI001CFAD5B3|nr:DUF4062 domain-containing protein [Ferribacterium limneticum]UCV20118.1 DUF4062 domain-containing protein [Ferribacterium limneticum]
MARIYISSTKDDLFRERQAVKDWLARNGHEPVDSYAPDSDPVLKSCLANVAACQLVTLIQGYRRGFVPTDDNPEQLSITHLEFRQARAHEIPVIALRTTRPDAEHSSLFNQEEMSDVVAFHQEINALVRPGLFGDTEELLEKLGQSVDAELAKLGLALPLCGLVASLCQASADLFQWPSTLPGGQWLAPPELDELRGIFANQTHSVTLLLGEPGCGKSALLAHWGNELLAQGVAVLGIKADCLPCEVTNAGELAKALRLPQTVEAMVRRIAQEQPVVVLIDQLDALAELVVQRPERLRVLLDLIRDLRGIERVHVVASCRIFEQRHDPALRRFELDTLTLALPEWSVVEAVLRERGVNAGAWAEAVRETLRSPHALNAFLSLLQGTHEPDLAQGLQGLLQQLWDERVIRADPSGRRRELMLALAESMAERESLWLPTARFEHLQQELQDLEREGLLIKPESEGKVSFRHQTWYEFLRARSFLEQGGRLTEAVLAGQSRLRIRPQLWHALIYMRRTDPGLYGEELSRLWQSELRPHLRMLLVEFMGMQQAPLPCEVQLAWGNFDDPWFQPRFLGAMTGSLGWFKEMEAGYLPLLMQRPVDECNQVRNLLDRALALAPEAVLALVDRYWLPNPALDTQSWTLLVQSDVVPADLAWVARLETIIGRTEVAKWHINEAISMVSALFPDEAPRLLVAWLQRRWQAVQKEGDSTEAVRKLLESESLRDLPAVAEAAPTAFIRGVWPMLLSLFGKSAAQEHQILIGYRQCGGLLDPWADEAWRHEQPLLESFAVGVRGWAKKEPAAFCEFMAKYQDVDLLPIQRLLVMGLAECVESYADFALDYVCADSRRLVLGPYSDHHQESRALISALVPHLNDGQLARLEEAIIGWQYYKGHFPEDDASIRLRRLRTCRQHRYRLLRSIPEEKLSAKGRQLLREEERAFPNTEDQDIRFTGISCIGSRVSAEQMAKAPVADILALFDELTDDTGWDHPRYSMEGGAIQAGGALARMLEFDPAKVIEVVRQLTPGRNELPVSDVIRDISKAKLSVDETLSLIGELIQKGFSSKHFKHSAAYAIKSLASSSNKIPQALVNSLEGWLESVDPASETVEREDKNDPHNSVLWGFGGLAALPGGNFPILAALSKVCLSASPPALDRWLDILEKHLNRSEAPQVWSAFASHDFFYLHQADHERAQIFLDRLFAIFPSIFGEVRDVRLMAELQRWISPDYAKRWLAVMAKQGERGLQGSGEVLMLRRAWRQNEVWLSDTLEELLVSVAPEAPLQKAGVAHTVIRMWEEPSFRSLAHGYLLRLLPSDEKPVRDALGEIFRLRSAWPPDRLTWELMDALAENPALFLDGRAEHFPAILEELVEYQPIRVASLAHVLIDTVGAHLADTASGWAFHCDSLISVALRLQDMPGEISLRGVELFERLLEFNVLTAAEMALSLDRRTPNAGIRHRIPRRRLKR